MQKLAGQWLLHRSSTVMNVWDGTLGHMPVPSLHLCPVRVRCPRYAIRNAHGCTPLTLHACLRVCACSFNNGFTSRQVRIKIPLPPVDEKKKVIEDVDKDRKHAIDAAIVRVMKSRKVCQVNSHACGQIQHLGLSSQQPCLVKYNTWGCQVICHAW